MANVSRESSQRFMLTKKQAEVTELTFVVYEIEAIIFSLYVIYTSDVKLGVWLNTSFGKFKIKR